MLDMREPVVESITICYSRIAEQGALRSASGVVYCRYAVEMEYRLFLCGTGEGLRGSIVDGNDKPWLRFEFGPN
jgi:hypothetical protein